MSSATPESISSVQTTTTLCYGAKGSTNDCKTCDDVIDAYKGKKWSYDSDLFAQCKKENRPRETYGDISNIKVDNIPLCYGAKGSTNDCKTCDDVINAYKGKKWSYDSDLFAQCKKENRPRETYGDISNINGDNNTDKKVAATPSTPTPSTATPSTATPSTVTPPTAQPPTTSPPTVPPPTAQPPTTSQSSADSMLYNNKDWNTDYMPIPIKKEEISGNPIRDIIAFFIFFNWIIGAIVFVASFNFTNISSNDVKRSVITFVFGLWGYIMYETELLS
jgi:hypothetical protein